MTAGGSVFEDFSRAAARVMSPRTLFMKDFNVRPCGGSSVYSGNTMGVHDGPVEFAEPADAIDGAVADGAADDEQ